MWWPETPHRGCWEFVAVSRLCRCWADPGPQQQAAAPHTQADMLLQDGGFTSPGSKTQKPP